MDLSILDRELDDIEDLPGFVVPANGEYILNVKTEFKEVNKKSAVEIGYEMVECVKKDNDADADSKPGDKFSQLFFLSGDGKDPEKDAEMLKLSLGKMKELVSQVAEQTGNGNLGSLLRDTLSNAVVTATVKRRQDKEDKEKFYATVKNLRLA